MDFLVTKPCDAIRHLDGTGSEFATTSRFRIHYLTGWMIFTHCSIRFPLIGFISWGIRLAADLLGCHGRLARFGTAPHGDRGRGGDRRAATEGVHGISGHR